MGSRLAEIPPDSPAAPGDGGGNRRTTTDVIEPLPLNPARSTGIGLDEPGHTTIPPGDTQICHILPAPRCPALGFDVANGKVQIYGDGHNRVSWISVQDVAEFAVRALESPGAINATVK